MSTRNVIWALCAAVVVVAPPACSSRSTSDGTIQVLVTDKPFPVEFIASAVVTVTRVEVRRAEGTAGGDQGFETISMPTNEQLDQDEEVPFEFEGDETFSVIFDGEKAFDLLALQNGRTDLLADADIAAGRYTQMRLFTPGGVVTLTDGRTFELDAPSGDSSGIKLNFTFDVTAGEQTTLLLDVDLSRAFNAVPGGMIEDPATISSFKFHPSTAMKLIDVVDAGTVSGTVTRAGGTALGKVWVTAYAGTEEVAGTATAEDGTYRIIGLPAGTYRLEFSKSGFVDGQREDIEVEAGAEASGVDISLAASAE